MYPSDSFSLDICKSRINRVYKRPAIVLELHRTNLVITSIHNLHILLCPIQYKAVVVYLICIQM